MDVEITPLAASLPSDFDELVEESIGEGYRFLELMHSEWACGAGLFSGLGECLFRAHFGFQTVGVCGRTRDPYVVDDRVGRIRHLYVRREARSQSVGSRLLATVLNGAGVYFSELRLRTTNPVAARLFLKHGFHPVAGDANATHRLDLRPEAVNLSPTLRRRSV
jgi:GNAT superfamily N-acetyltransferase